MKRRYMYLRNEKLPLIAICRKWNLQAGTDQIILLCHQIKTIFKPYTTTGQIQLECDHQWRIRHSNCNWLIFADHHYRNCCWWLLNSYILHHITFVFFIASLWTVLVPKAAIKIIEKIARFSSFSCNFCHIWCFFWVLQYIWHSSFWKIIKYCKKFGENEEKSFNYSIT